MSHLISKLTPSNIDTFRTIYEELGLHGTKSRTDDPNLLAKEVPDFQRAATILDDTVDGEVSVHRAHLVLEALRETFHESFNTACSDDEPW